MPNTWQSLVAGVVSNIVRAFLRPVVGDLKRTDGTPVCLKLVSTTKL